MKPCVKNKKLITWLALDALEARQALVLREHLTKCEACRRYLEEITSVTAKLASAETASDVYTSGSFHQKVASRLKSTEPNSVWSEMSVILAWLKWRMIPPTIAALMVTAIVLSVEWQHSAIPPQNRHTAQIVPALDMNQIVAPTMVNYERAANQSIEKLDKLLTEQGNQNFSRSPIYTALPFIRENSSFGG
jgi:predicted anti-sigma-YlaC factor YlaD